jgi:hypothetical protein
MARLFLLLMMMWLPLAAHAAGEPASSSAETVMQNFVQQQDDGVSAQRKISDKRKQQILLLMGVGLLIGLFTTGGLGISMVVFEKQVYVAHMISAGLTITLAIAHAVTSIVWFWPY